MHYRRLVVPIVTEYATAALWVVWRGAAYTQYHTGSRPRPITTGNNYLAKHPLVEQLGIGFNMRNLIDFTIQQNGGSPMNATVCIHMGKFHCCFLSFTIIIIIVTLHN